MRLQVQFDKMGADSDPTPTAMALNIGSRLGHYDVTGSLRDRRPGDLSTRTLPMRKVQMALEPGSMLGSYQVTALIGEGGMGQVYQATDTKPNRHGFGSHGRFA